MQQKALYIFGVFIFLIGGFLWLVRDASGPQEVIVSLDHKNAEYVIDGQRVRLVGGVSETPAVPGSATVITTRYFGNEVRHDLNLDGREDVVFLVTQDTGGTGTFYYVIAALNMEGGYIGGHGLFLGDRIAPQTTEMSREVGRENIIVVNYADRKQGESFAVSPSMGKSIWLKFDPATMQFGEVVQNFEGEADPSIMTLDMKKWLWIRAVYNDGKVITPKKPQAFTLTFSKNGQFSATTDCNGIGGEYTATKEKITFTQMMSTLMFCEGSEEGEFAKLLNESQGYHFTSKGELILELKFDSGFLVFR